MSTPAIRRALPADIPVLAEVRHAPWPEGSVAEHVEELPRGMRPPLKRTEER